MKKLICLLLCLLLPLAALAEAAAPLTAADFTLTAGENVLVLGSGAALWLEALEALTGTPLDKTETVSCMFDGMDREYANDAVIVGTYPIGEGGGDAVESVIVFTDALRTARGAAVGMAQEEIEALYGDDYFLDWDTMIYSQGMLEPQLMFTLDLESGAVISWMLLRNTVS